MPKAVAAPASQYAVDLIAALQRRISVDDLANCAAANLKATKLTRLNKDEPKGTEEPDYQTRQKALEWIGDKILPNAGSYKPVEIQAAEADTEKPTPGMLKRREK